MTVNQELTPQWVNYLDLQDDVKPYLQMSPGVASDDTLLQDTLDVACTWVQNYLGRPVAPTEYFRRFNGMSGNMGAYLSLPYYPVIEVKKVIEYWGTSGPHELAEQTPSNQGNSEMFQLDPLRGILSRTFQGLVLRPWFPGARNVEVTWVAGYNPLPADIRRATLKLIAHEWRSEQQASRSAPAPAGGEFDPDTGMQMGFGGIPRDTYRYLEPYTQQGMG
jgi:hypothetical protein